MLVFSVFTALSIIIYQYYGYDLIHIVNSNKSESIKIIYNHYYERYIKFYNNFYAYLFLWSYIISWCSLINLNILTKIWLIHLYINTQKQIFRERSKTNITGIKVDLKRSIEHNICTNLALASKLFYVYFSFFQNWINNPFGN